MSDAGSTLFAKEGEAEERDRTRKPRTKAAVASGPLRKAMEQIAGGAEEAAGGQCSDCKLS